MSFRAGDRVRFVDGPGAVVFAGEVFEVLSAPMQCPVNPSCPSPVYELSNHVIAHEKMLERVPPDADFIPAQVRALFRPQAVKERA